MSLERAHEFKSRSMPVLGLCATDFIKMRSISGEMLGLIGTVSVLC